MSIRYSTSGPGKWVAGAAFVALLALGQGISRAATIEFTARGGSIAGADSESPHWAPAAAAAAAAGDTIVWHFADNPNGHDVISYASDHSYFVSPEDVVGDYSRTFEGGTVWFRSRPYSTLNPNGMCGGMCGGYTDRLSAPDAPVITSPPSGATVNGRIVTVTGTAQPLTIVRISDNGSLLYEAMSTREGTWSFQLFLAHGEHVVSAQATDVLGRSGPAGSVTFMLDDDRPPTVSVESGDPALLLTPLGAVLRGTASDASGIGSIIAKISGTPGEPATFAASCPNGCSGPSVTWQVDFTSRVPGYYYVVLVVHDIHGNETQRAVQVLKV